MKAAKADAGKAAKKKPDPEGLALLEKAEAALAAKDMEQALALFREAEQKCKDSTVEAVSKEKKPKEKAPPAAKEGGDADAAVAAEAAEVCAYKLCADTGACASRAHGAGLWMVARLERSPGARPRARHRRRARSRGCTSPIRPRIRRPSRCATASTRRTTTRPTRARSCRRT